MNKLLLRSKVYNVKMRNLDLIEPVYIAVITSWAEIFIFLKVYREADYWQAYANLESWSLILHIEMGKPVAASISVCVCVCV